MTLPGQVQINEQGRCTIGADGRPNVTPVDGSCCCGGEPECWMIANACVCPGGGPNIPPQVVIPCASIPPTAPSLWTFITSINGVNGCYTVNTHQTPMPNTGGLPQAGTASEVSGCNAPGCCSQADCTPFNQGQLGTSFLITVPGVGPWYSGSRSFQTPGFNNKFYGICRYDINGPTSILAIPAVGAYEGTAEISVTNAGCSLQACLSSSMSAKLQCAGPGHPFLQFYYATLTIGTTQFNTGCVRALYTSPSLLGAYSLVPIASMVPPPSQSHPAFLLPCSTSNVLVPSGFFTTPCNQVSWPIATAEPVGSFYPFSITEGNLPSSVVVS